MGKVETTLVQEKRAVANSELKIPRSLRVSLRIIEGKNKGQTFSITMSSTIVGRGEGADILVDDELMSRRHFQITYRNLEFRIQDLGSINSTFLNGSEVKEYALRNGDRIYSGDTMFLFIVEMNPQNAQGR